MLNKLYESGIRSHIAIPLMAGEKVVGLFALSSVEANAYTDEHMSLLASIAPHLATAVQNAQLYRDIKHRAETDNLTGLLNLPTFYIRLREQIANSEDGSRPVSVVMLDLDLFKAVTSRCFRQTLELFQRAAEGKRGEEALEAMGNAYTTELLPDRTFLRAQMQAYAACEDDEIREVVRNGYGDLVAYAERVSDLPAEAVGRFFATGMLLNVIASMGLQNLEEPWAARLVAGVKTK